MVLCKIAEVSISWYYKHVKKIKLNKTKKILESSDLDKIKNIVLKYNRKHGYRMVTMLLRNKWIIFNHKKVYRIMKKYNLLSKVRSKNIYKRMAKKIHEHSVVKNLINREFNVGNPFEKLWTDISYLKYGWNTAYLSIIKDMISWEILAHDVSSSLWLWLVYRTMDKLNKLKQTLNLDLSWSIIHSDQWFHYTHKSFWEKVLILWMRQSMSRKWNCIDNAPTESFFWHLKDDLEISKYKSLKELENKIDYYIHYYNNTRPQRNRKKMTPIKYRNHLLSKNL